MSTLGGAVRHIRHTLRSVSVASHSDESLLQAFARHSDDDAFTALVRRHGPLVRGVCRRLLRNNEEADDTFQATFLVLARKAGSIRRQQSVGSWLYGVAYRLALKARTRLARRQRHERPAPAPEPSAPEAESWSELRGLLDEELNRLPEKYRSPLLLCYLEGQTQDEAARRLGWPLGTFRRRLDRGRELLRGRLGRRGFPLAAALLAAGLSQGGAAALPPTLVAATVRAASAFALGTDPVAAVSPHVVLSAKELLNAMIFTKLKVVVVGLLVLGALFTGAAALLPGGGGSGEAAAVAFVPAPDEKPESAMEKPWAELSATDNAAALRALLLMYRSPKESVPFVCDRMKVLLAGEAPASIARMIEDLDSPKFAVREKATRDLEESLEEAAPFLQKVLNNRPSLDLKRRVDLLLSRRKATLALGARRAQILRGMVLLEVVGSAEAKRTLEAIARDGKEEWLSQEADGALLRLAAEQPFAAWDELTSTEPGVAARAFLTLAAKPVDGTASAEQIQEVLKLASQVPPLLLRSRGVTTRQLPHELLPYRREPLAEYKSDVKETDLRAAVVDSVKLLIKSEKSDLIINEELLAVEPNELPQFRKEIEAIQRDKIGEAYLKLVRGAEELEDLKDERRKETKLWQANYDYVLARLYARQACILEYSVRLGQFRRDDMPALDPERHKGWILTTQNMVGDRDAKESANKARELLKRLAAEHKGTPWEVIAQHEMASPFGLTWEPLAK